MFHYSQMGFVSGNDTQWNFAQSQGRIKFCHLQVNCWNWRTSSEMMVTRIRRPKSTMCSLSYVECRPHKNAEILWNIGHTKGRSCTGVVGKLWTWI
jgi:hypothetical protein